MASRIGDLLGYWLAVSCSCGQHTKLPLKLLARQRGSLATVAALLPRLKCGRCGERPERVETIDDPAAGSSGRGVESEWRLALRP